jgi:hypothetical protein
MLEEAAQLGGGLAGAIAAPDDAMHAAHGLGEFEVHEAALDEDPIELADASLELAKRIVHDALLVRVASPSIAEPAESASAAPLAGPFLLMNRKPPRRVRIEP